MADLKRRDALKTIATGLSATAAIPLVKLPAEAAAPKPAAFKFFTASQHETVTILTELIIPTDERSPGAKEAKVSDFIDLMVSESSETVKKRWTDGLAELDRMGKEKFGKDAFKDLTAEQQTEVLTEISRNEKDPQTLVDRFFVDLKNRTIDGYYTSEIGIHKELQYKGNTYLKEFVGCTHPEHQS